MGFFSWNTSDTGKSIANSYSSRRTFTVHMVCEDGQIFTENDYEGYGEFGGKDIYELIAEMNGCEFTDIDRKRSWAIELTFKDNPSGEFAIASARGVKCPKLVERLPRPDDNWFNWWAMLPYPSGCDYQGFFYDDEDDED